ncbi:MAG: hypothetical protein AUI36_41095, partial [Cyanobacteria bacterium 13_1_40CM_2_61_4]
LMRCKYYYVVALLFLSSITVAAQTDAVDKYVKTEMQRKHIPGLTLALIKDGKVIKQRAYGLANIELNVPASVGDVYQIASTTKTFTGAAIMTLVEEGKLSLDDKVTKLLPELRAAWGEVTVRHCLTHTSGLPDVFADECSEAIAETRDEALKKLALMPVRRPGEKWEYNTTGYVLLGMIIERLSGVSYEEFLARRFFRPLGMTSSRFGDYKEIIKGRTSLYTNFQICRGNDFKMSSEKIWTALVLPYTYVPYEHPGAGLNSTIGDLVKWNLAIDKGRVLRQSTLNEMWTAVKLNDGKIFRSEGTEGYGCGWFVDDRPKHKAVGHFGGLSTGYIKYLDDKLTVIVLTNLEGADAEPLVKGIAALHISELRQAA